MVTFLSSWVKNLSLALIVVSILEMILPNNKTKKYIKTIMGLYILFSIISPFIKNSNNLNLSEFNINSYAEGIVEASSNEVVNQESMDKRIKKIYVQELEKDITSKIKEKGYTVSNCKVDVDGIEDGNIKNITVKLKDKNENLNSEENYKNNKINIENVLVEEIQKVKIQVSNNKEEQQSNNSSLEEEENKNESKQDSSSKITKTDIQNIKNFLIEEYGVSEKCLKIN
ncbi:stage III sporulation protein AF [Clostridium sp. CAG:575]|nr:stage III sporulation protein AF [Clostridium sp. CAG:575]